jgi:hypothetical protein
MEQPRATAEHKKLERLVGKWIGEEMIQGSPHTTETKARGTFDIRTHLNGLFASITSRPLAARHSWPVTA